MAANKPTVVFVPVPRTARVARLARAAGELPKAPAAVKLASLPKAVPVIPAIQAIISKAELPPAMPSDNSFPDDGATHVRRSDLARVHAVRWTDGPEDWLSPTRHKLDFLAALVQRGVGWSVSFENGQPVLDFPNPRANEPDAEPVELTVVPVRVARGEWVVFDLGGRGLAAMSDEAFRDTHVEA